MVSEERSWGDVKKIKSGKISALGSDISDKKSVVYTSACIEEEKIGKTLLNRNSKDVSHSHSWNEDDHTFDYQLYQRIVDKLFQNPYEVIIRDLKMYIVDWEKLNIKNKRQLSRTTFLAKYGSLALYDIYTEKILFIDHKQLQFDKNSVWTLICNSV